MLTLLHISDLHFGPPYLPAVGAALLRIAPTLGAHGIVASGDFTQRAKRQQFADARAFLDQLPDLPRVVVLGNHDVPLYRLAERFFRPHQLYREFIAPELDTVHQFDGAVIVGLDSTAPRQHITNGRIFQRQLDFCTVAFRDVPSGVARIVVAHHHFAPAPDYQRDQIMPRAKQAMEHFIGLGVEMVLGGHLHRGYIGNSLDVGPGRSDGQHDGVIIVQSGTTTSRRGRARERARNSFNLIHLDAATIQIVHYMYFADSERFEPISEHRFPRRGKRLG